MRRILMLLPLVLAAPAPALEPVSTVEAILAAEDARNPAAPGLLSALDPGSPAIRARVATAFGRIMRPEGVDPLLGLLADPDPGVRAEAIFSLGQLAWTADASKGREKEIVARLEPFLADADETLRRLGVEAVGKLAMDDAPRLLTPLLKDAAASVRAEAATAMFRHRFVTRLRSTATPPPTLPDLAEPSLQALLALKADPDELVRRNVAYYFARIKDARGLAAMTELARDSSLWVRLFAVTALGKTEDPEAAPAAAAAAKDPDYRIRLAAVQALAVLKQGALVPPELAKDPTYHVRAAVAEAWASAEKADEAALEELGRDPSVPVRAAALKALVARRKSAGIPLLEAALGDASPIVRQAAAEAAASLEKDGEPLLARALKDSEEPIRVTAIEALGTRETPEALEVLRAAAEAPGIGERGTAAEALKARKEPAALELAWKVYQASPDHKWIEVREALVDAFAAHAGDEGGRHLRAALQDPAPSVAAKARAALEARGATDLPPPRAPERSVTPFLELRFTKNPVVVLETSKGTIRVEAFADDAPVHVASLVGLVRKGFYDGLLWHRVVPNFVIQGGDPLGTGWGDAGWSLRAEVNRRRFERGFLGMARAQGFDTGSCQLFFTLVPTPHLDGQYTIFGRIVEGEEVIDRIERGDRIVKATVVD